MEDNTKALEIVCQHFKTEYGDDTIANLRKRLTKAYRRNSDLKSKLVKAICQNVSAKLMNEFLIEKFREFAEELADLNKQIDEMSKPL